MDKDFEILEKINSKFELFSNMIRSCSEGKIRGLFVTGDPGFGKSFFIEQTLKLEDLKKKTIRNEDFLKLKNKLLSSFKDKSVDIGSTDLIKEADSYRILDGYVRPGYIYQTLYHLKDLGEITVFDNCDSVLSQEDSLNIIKSALEPDNNHLVSWGRTKADSNLPESYQYNGSIIFVTNQKIEDILSSPYSDHIKAILSRCFLIDLSFSFDREKLLYIKQLLNSGILNSQNIDSDTQNQIWSFILENSKNLIELSPSMLLKIAKLYKNFNLEWKKIAIETCMKR